MRQQIARERDFKKEERHGEPKYDRLREEEHENENENERFK